MREFQTFLAMFTSQTIDGMIQLGNEVDVILIRMSGFHTMSQGVRSFVDDVLLSIHYLKLILWRGAFKETIQVASV